VYILKTAEGIELQCKPVFQLLAEIASKYEPSKAEEITWIPEELIHKAAQMMGAIKPVCLHTFTGIEQNTNAAQAGRAIHILYALTGCFDSPGGNVVHHWPPSFMNAIAGDEILDPKVIERRVGFKEHPLSSHARGEADFYDIYDAIINEKPYPIKAGIAFGCNCLVLTCDARKCYEALKKLEFLAAAELFLTPTVDLFADIVLPAASTWESEHVGIWCFIIGFMHLPNYMQLRRAVVPPLYERWPDMKIIFELAKRLGIGDKFWNGDIEAAFNYMIAPSGYTVDDLRKNPRGIALPYNVKYRKYAERNPSTGGYVGVNTKTKKIEIFCTAYRELGYPPLPDFEEPAISPVSKPELAKRFPLILIDARRRGFTQSQFHGLPSLRKRIPYPYVEIHPKTAEELGIKDGDWVYIETIYGKCRQQAKVTDNIHPKVVCATFGWWQSCPQLGLPCSDPLSEEGANFALLVTSEYKDPILGSVPLNGILCRIFKAKGDTNS
ncbi:MAG: molybdopterin-dependent oxidoreductase, partial [Candidatus Bathyarchaeia archaeon]